MVLSLRLFTSSSGPKLPERATGCLIRTRPARSSARTEVSDDPALCLVREGVFLEHREIL